METVRHVSRGFPRPNRQLSMHKPQTTLHAIVVRSGRGGKGKPMHSKTHQ